MTTVSEKRNLSADEERNLQDIAHQLRIDSLDATSAAGSGHLTSASSMAEILAVLFFRIMRFDVHNPRHPCNDRLVLSKGHACPILYSAWTEGGYMKRDMLLTLRKIDSPIEGHPSTRLDFIDVATGSLGNGLGNACGIAYVAKYLDHIPFKVFCILGDGEVTEGAVWEACTFASYYNLNNLCAVVDVNRLGQTGPTPLEHDLDTYRKRFEAFGWDVEIVDGHSIQQLYSVFQNRVYQESPMKRPLVVLAKTLKGKYIKYAEDRPGFHGKPCPKDQYTATRESLVSRLSGSSIHTTPLGLLPEQKSEKAMTPRRVVQSTSEKPIRLSSPTYEKGKVIATREAFGNALKKMADDQRIIVLCADVKDSTFAERFLGDKGPSERYIECFIAEQNMVLTATGCATRGRTIPFVCTFSTFFTRAHDQIRMASISGANVKFCGSHCGVAIGEDGPSQMGLEDLALFRSIMLPGDDGKGCVIFYPSDAVATERAVELAANIEGMVYIRTNRSATEVIYDKEAQFLIGEAKVVRKGQNDIVTVIGAGVTLFEALKAAKELEAEGISIRVIDPFTVKPLDKEHILKNVLETNGHVIVVEDHYPAGGLGEAVAGLFSDDTKVSVTRLAVNTLPRSGTADELLDYCGISARHIKNEVKKKAAILTSSHR